MKQYKKCIKACDAVIKTDPNNQGILFVILKEVLCLKALSYTNLSQYEDATTLIRLALKLNIKNYSAWNILATVLKLKRNYAEAVKAYLNSLKFSPDKLQVLRDLCACYTQLRMFDELIVKIFFVSLGC